MKKTQMKLLSIREVWGACIGWTIVGVLFGRFMYHDTTKEIVSSLLPVIFFSIALHFVASQRSMNHG